MSLASARSTQEVAGIAWWAHVGGFLFGAAIGAIWRMARKRAVAIT
jgi:membrane associated rhomboid family serine protease